MGIGDGISNLFDDVFGTPPRTHTPEGPTNFLSSLSQALDRAFGGEGEPGTEGYPANAVYDSYGGEQTAPIDGISNIGDDPLLSHGVPRELDIAKQKAIIQRRDLGFNVVNINPFVLDTTNFGPIPTIQQLSDIVGYEGETNFGSGANQVSKNAWRSVTLEVQGDYFKLDFLPPIVNTQDQDDVSGGKADELMFRKLDQAQLANGAAPAGATFQSIRNRAVGRQILVQFDSAASPIIVARPGDIFRLQFSKVILTFKVWCPRFQVVTGFGSSIIPSVEHRTMHANPAFGPGYGLWDNPSRHCTPFSWQSSIMSLGAVASTLSQDIFKNSTNPVNTGVAAPNPNGTIIGWITNVIVSMQSNTGQFQGNMVLATDDQSYSLFHVPFTANCPAGNFNNFQIAIPLAVPIRFLLLPGKRLFTQVANITAIAANFFVAVQGYAFGLVQTQNGSASSLLWTADNVTDAPFPLDLVQKTGEVGGIV